MIKIVALLLSMSFLAACRAENATDDEVTKAHDMFAKQKTENYVIFSPLQGVLMEGGEPLPNVKIIRRLKWNGNEEGLVEEFTTDDRGRFSLPLHEEPLALGVLSQFVASVDLELKTERGCDYLWTSSKFFPEIYTETDGKVEGLICDVNSEEIAVPMGATSILTKCRWKNMPE